MQFLSLAEYSSNCDTATIDVVTITFSPNIDNNNIVVVVIVLRYTFE